jgi:hypothetical protein
MPFHLRDIIFQARFDAFEEWKRLREELPAKPEAEAGAHSTGKHDRRDPLAAFAPWCGVDWTRPSGDLCLLADHLEASARWPNRGLAVLGALSIISGLCGRHTYGPTGAAPNLYITACADGRG